MKNGKKLLSLLLSLMLVLGAVSVGFVSASAALAGNGTADNPYKISDYAGLKEFASIVNGGNSSACAILTKDFSAWASDPEDEDYDSANAWTPIGNYDNKYTGTFDGDGHVINGLTFNDPSADYAGLFGYVGAKTEGGVTTKGTVKNVVLEDGSITGRYDVGGVVGKNEDGTVTNCRNTGNVSGDDGVGGIAGYNEDGTVTDCSNTGDVSGNYKVGGVAGINFNGTVISCSNSGDVTVTEDGSSAGGVTGSNSGIGTVANCYNTGNVSGDSNVGGVVGLNSDSSTVVNCYNMGNVSGELYTGGVAGLNTGSSVANCYNTGTVTGTGTSFSNLAGGVIGLNNGATVTNCYNTGKVTVTGTATNVKIGGVVGDNVNSTVEYCYYDSDSVTGVSAIGDETYAISSDATGLTTTDMTGVSALDKMVFDYENGEESPWLVRENDIFADYYPHLSGFDYDNTGIAGDWPAHILKDGPYEIETYSQLRDFASIVNNNLNTSACAKLMNNIDASSSVQANDWTPIGNIEIRYTGTFDGDGHIITGLYYKNPSADDAGLFGYVGDGGTVKNTGLEGGSITGLGFVGGVVGDNSGTVTNCYNTGSVSGSYAGGVVGENSGTVTNCYNTGDVSGNHYVGGVVGYNFRGTVTNCYNTGDVSGNLYVGGVVGKNYSTVTNCYNTGDVSGNSHVGGVVGENANGTVTNCYYDKDVCQAATAIGDASDSETVKGLTTAEMTGANALENMSFSNAEGGENPWLVRENDTFADYYPHLKGFDYDNTGALADWPARILKDGPYEIETYTQLKDFASIVNKVNTSACAKLMNDIDASSSAQANDWTPIGNYDNEYTGTFDGDGHVITGLTFNNSYVDFVGLFGYVGEGGVVQNVGLEGGKITGKSYVGGVAGKNYCGKVTNCYNTGDISGVWYVGGVVGDVQNGEVTYCYNTGDVSGNLYIGGDIGGGYSFSVSNCYNTGDVSGSSSVGGIVGSHTFSSVSDCYNTGNVSATGDSTSVGGVVGYNSNYCSVSRCYSTGAVTATGTNARIGGVAGLNYYGEVTNCFYDKTAVTIPGASADNDWKAVGKNSEGSVGNVKGLTTAEMTGANALENMSFSTAEGEESPWLVKENHCQNDFYPHLKGFNLDENKAQIPAESIDAENWPPKTDTGSGEHKYGETGDDRFTCSVCGQVDDDLKAAAELADAKEEAKAELEDYKDPADYRAGQQTELENAVAAGKENIDSAADKDAVAAALSAAKEAIDAIKTDAQLTAEEQAEFDEYKEDKKDEIDALAQDGDSDEVKELIDNAKDEIDKLTYDESKSLDENKAAVDEAADLTQLKESIAEHRKEYTAKFIADGETVKEIKFTIDTGSIEAPDVPEKTGYTGEWESYSLGASDITINAVYAPVKYTAAFIADGKTVAEVPFTVETESITEPAVPEKEGYTGEWSKYTLGASDIEINAVYTEIPAEPATPDEPATETEPENDNLCPLDGTDHGTTFMGKIIKFFHSILWSLFRLVGLDLNIRITWAD